MFWRLGVELIVCLHFLFILFVVFGSLLAWRKRGWKWVHLAAMAYGLSIELGGWICPLTWVENWFRHEAGVVPYEGTFIAQHLERLIYFDASQGALVAGAVVVIVLNLAVYRHFERKQRLRSKRLGTVIVWSGIFLAALGALGCGDGGGEQGPIELQLGHVASPGSLVALSAEEFARRANEKLGEAASVVVFGSSQLGTDERLLQKLKLGTIDFSLPSTIMSSVVDECGLFEMPYLIKDRDHMGRIESEIFWNQIAPATEAKGYKVLAVWENGFRHITNNTRPITVPADLQGIKLRTPKGRWRVKMFQTYGANPTPMSLSEVFVALQTGVMDGEENPLSQIHSQKFQEVQTYLSLTRHLYSPAFLTVSTRKWNALPEPVRSIIEQTAKDTQEYVYATARKIDEELLAELTEAGMEVNEADQEAFRAASRAIYEEFGETVPGGREMIEAAIALADR